ncbi:hypothetical protein [Nocardioides sp. KR10-350]|uniref:hypothetical protein n=1 Tax=Nocardioides cheoyonin TaxID=3156615 RepID=UPI0032B36C34
MSTTTTPARPAFVHHLGGPLAASLGAWIAWAVAMIGNWQSGDDKEDTLSTLELLAYVGLGVAVIALATFLGARALAGGPGRVAGTSLGLAIASAVTWIGFWSSWPVVFAGVAILLAVEYRRRVGAFSGPAAFGLGLGILAGAAALVVCVIG